MEFFKCVVYLALLGLGAFAVGRILPGGMFDPEVFPFKGYSFEKSGRFYEKFGIKRWKDKLIDMSKIFPDIMPAKRLHNVYDCRNGLFNSLPILIRETCIAEFTHSMLCIMGFLCMAIWEKTGGVCVSVLYAVGNVPFIMVQRYNRQRYMCVMKRQNGRAEKSVAGKGVVLADADADIKL